MFAEAHKLFCKLDVDKAAGVAILVHASHVSFVRRVHRISDRVLAIDICIAGKLTRLINVYFPHSGLPVAVLDECYHQVFALIEDALSKHIAIVIGGDFNSTLDDSSRGMQLQELVDSFSLQICNDPHRLEFDDAWTYEHTLHGRHHIDYILASRHFQVENARAVSDLDLGSDHRAVRATLKTQTRIPRRRQLAKKCQTWMAPV